MRSDIIPGAVFPNYELSNHRGMHRTLSELKESIRWQPTGTDLLGASAAIIGALVIGGLAART
jgi:hypothetical protein